MHFSLGHVSVSTWESLISDPTRQFLDVEDPTGTHLHAYLSPVQTDISFQNLASFLPAIPLYCLGTEYHDDDGTGSMTF